MSLSDQLTEQRRKVDFDTYDITVQQMLAMLDQKAINVAPTYQRLYRWDHKRQCQLIESIFLGIPIPSLFMAANSDGTWEVVDGVQRISTLVDYAGGQELRARFKMGSPLSISGLEKLTELVGVFDQLPPSVQLQFLLRPIKVVTLSDKSDLVVRFDLFERLNTGGIELTDQEIRSCIFRGPFDDFLTELSKTGAFRQVVLLPENREKDGTREEYVLRFFAFLDRYLDFDHSVKSFLNDYMRDSSRSFEYGSKRRQFDDTFKALAAQLPGGLRKRTKTTPVNLYEGISVGTALALQTGRPINWSNLGQWVMSDELKRVSTGATNNKKVVRARIEETRDVLLS